MANTLSKELAKDREQTLDFAMSTMAKAGIETSGIDDNGNNSVSLIEKISSNVNNGSTFETSKMERAEFSTTLIPSEKMGGGFSLRPTEFEFWEDGDFRLHDRFILKPTNIKNEWIAKRHYP